jgi:hypothetical protein
MPASPSSRVRSFLRVAAAIGMATAALQAPAAAAELSVERLWRYEHAPARPGQKAEIVAYDRRTDTLWVAGTVGVDVLARRSGQLLGHIDVTGLGAVNSVAVHGGLAALAVENTVDRTQPGVVVFYDTRTLRRVGDPVSVGSLPDMLTFTPDGRRVLVANEGTPNPRDPSSVLSTADPQGSVSVIDVRSRRVTTLPLTPSIPGYAELRLFPAGYSAYDPEPESITVDRAGRYAYVTLQEANGMAVLDLRRLAFERIVPLGIKDYGVEGNELDATDRDGGGSGTGRIELQRGLPLKGLYQPDTIASYHYRGHTYLVMANEGDARDNGSADSEDEVRASALGVTDARFARANLSRLESQPGGPYVMFGARSFSIRDAQGRIVYDSGSILDRESIRRGLVPGADPSSIANTLYDDARSDNKGMEPEGVALLRVKGRMLAFIGLERGKAGKSAVAVFDITSPHDVHFLDMIVSDGDTSPEGLTAFKVQGRYFLAVANEVSDTTSLFELRLARGHHDRDDEDDSDEDDGAQD